MIRYALCLGFIINFIGYVPQAQSTTSGETVPIDPPPNVLKLYAEWAKKNQHQESLLVFVRRIAERAIVREKSDDGCLRFPWIERPVGVFVTAMKGQKVRSCVGVFTSRSSSLQRELVRQCKRLATGDPRHAPLQATELGQLKFVVTLTGTPRPIDDPSTIDLWREGLLASWDGREAVLLPGEAKTLAWGIRELRRQIRIPSDRTPRYACFPVLVLSEPDQRANR